MALNTETTPFKSSVMGSRRQTVMHAPRRVVQKLLRRSGTFPEPYGVTLFKMPGISAIRYSVEVYAGSGVLTHVNIEVKLGLSGSCDHSVESNWQTIFQRKSLVSNAMYLCSLVLLSIVRSLPLSVLGDAKYACRAKKLDITDNYLPVLAAKHYMPHACGLCLEIYPTWIQYLKRKPKGF